MKIRYHNQLYIQFFIKRLLIIAGCSFLVILMPFLLLKQFDFLFVIILFVVCILITLYLTWRLKNNCAKNTIMINEKSSLYHMLDTIEDEGIEGICLNPPMAITEKYIFHNYHNMNSTYMPFRNFIARDGVQLIFLSDFLIENDDKNHEKDIQIEINYLSYRGIEKVIIPILYLSNASRIAFLKEMMELSDGVGIPLIYDADDEEKEMVFDVFERHDHNEINSFMEFMKETYGSDES